MISSKELREKFLIFFNDNGHDIVPSSSLLPADPSVLFTTAGMQQFKPYYLGESSPYGQNAVSCQKCFRTSDIEEVGDERHLTFFEMLGNFSFGGYQKEKAIKLAKDFLDSINIKIDYVTVFSGNSEVVRDEESAKIWGELGFSEGQGNLKFCDKEDNFWGPTGDEGPCGPTTEIYSKGIEIWNIVFNQYYFHKDKTLTKLEIFGVDTGMGLERLAMVAQDKSNVFETDLFELIIREIGEGDEKTKRIIADHIKGAVFLSLEGVLPSNIGRGYVLRKILRRAMSFGKLLNLKNNFFASLVQEIITIYKDIYPDLLSKQIDIIRLFQDEFKRFEEALEKGIKEMERTSAELGRAGIRVVGAGDSLRIEQSLGVPFDIQKEFFATQGIVVQQAEHEAGREKHRDISRAGAEKKFGGVGKEASYESAKLHTATHLLHATLRKVLGNDVGQMGSDITSERLRFDFSFSRKMTEAEIKEVENMVNQKIKEDWEIKKEEMSYEEALGSGALAFFKEKYPARVTVYSVIDNSGMVFSKEICAGPHIGRTSELGSFKIAKEESSGAGIRRIRAILE